MRKLVYADADDELPSITSSIHSNAFPEGWREITVDEFSRSIFFTYTPDFMEYRQMGTWGLRSGDNSIWVSARLFHFHDGTGVAISGDSHEKKIHYYKFGCDHKYNELRVEECKGRDIYHAGACWHVYECEKCENIMSQDSSG